MMVDFGADPHRMSHHFAVLPWGSLSVQFVERQGGDEVLKAKLDPQRWQRISPEARGVFNTALGRLQLRPGRWRKDSPTLLTPHFGQELLLLVWAVEGQDLSLLPTICENWRKLAPEERWWLYSTINATSRHPDFGPDRGWRKAIKIALAETPA